MGSNIRINFYSHLGISILYLVAGIMLVGGNIRPSLGILYYLGIFLVSFLVIKGYITRIGLYSLLTPYFLMLGFGIWKYIFPHYTGILLAVLLDELFGRIMYKTLIKWKGTRYIFCVIPIFFFLFDFTFGNIPFLRDIHMIPLLSPISTHYLTIRGASLVGRHLLLSIITLILSSLVVIITDPKSVKIPSIVLVVCGLLIVIPNIFDLAISKSKVHYDKTLRVTVVQGSYNPPGDNMLYEDFIEDKLEYYIDLASRKTADIVVFPETELGIYDTSNKLDKKHRERFMDVSKKLGGILVFTVTEGNSLTKEKKERFISTLLMEEGNIKGISRKRNLVPFKETKVYSRGKDYGIHETKFGRLGISICYDINAGTIRKLKSNGAELILAPFNDSGFGEIYHNIHRYYPIIEAVEYGVPIAVANEDGISQIIDDNGRILGELGYGHIGTLTCLINLKTTNTLYLAIGKYVEWIIFWSLFSLVGIKSKIIRMPILFH